MYNLNFCSVSRGRAGFVGAAAARPTGGAQGGIFAALDKAEEKDIWEHEIAGFIAHTQYELTFRVYELTFFFVYEYDILSTSRSVYESVCLRVDSITFLQGTKKIQRSES